MSLFVFLGFHLCCFVQIGAAKVAAEDSYYAVKRGSVSSQDFEYTLKSMCKEGAYYGGFLVLPIEILPHIQEKPEDINANLKVLSR
ncbi:outer envelope pore protein 16, chloroplastic-like [Rosa rugosa]|uniref:outer envelope pore protein 16, chloroplastic-like n=1 Tax=Rosa rugosa TaxID=74645 RepID=UPI002B40F5E1|nr:outer envelope pore protein 16, chloroplastic-like [Rosa rugosa]